MNGPNEIVKCFQLPFYASFILTSLSEIYQKYGEDIRCDDVPHQDADRESGVRRFQQQSRRNAPIERFHDTEKSIRQNPRKESFDSDEDNWAQSNKFENRKNIQRYRGFYTNKLNFKSELILVVFYFVYSSDLKFDSKVM